MKANRAVRLAVLALPPLLLARQVPVVGQDEGGVARGQRGQAGAGVVRLAGMKRASGIVRGRRAKEDLEDVRPLQLEEDVVLREARGKG